MHALIVGCGYSGVQIGRALGNRGEYAPDSICDATCDDASALAARRVTGTRRTLASLGELEQHGIEGVVLDGAVSPLLAEHLASATHLISSVAPLREMPLVDPVLALLAPLIQEGALPELRWTGYLSTIGVYGDQDGSWIDEGATCRSLQTRSIARLAAEQAWQQLGRNCHLPVAILRLSGIYGPGKNAVVDACAGRSRMLIKPGQVFNRIHVNDLARATVAAAKRRYDGVLNITDDRPAPPQDVIRFAHGLVGRRPPPAVDFATADISPMARSFYSENKRVRNSRSRDVLDLQYNYPDYRAGLLSLASTWLDSRHPSGD